MRIPYLSTRQTTKYLPIYLHPAPPPQKKKNYYYSEHAVTLACDLLDGCHSRFFSDIMVYIKIT